MMTVLIFVIILGVLVFVHELGHFLLAKKAGVTVEEFGFGYPPRALKLGCKWGTVFSLNWIPFGGFVKIKGENYEEDVSHVSSLEHSQLSRKTQKLFTQASKKWQITILAAGVTFNVIFAWLLFSLGFMIGLPTPVENDYDAQVENPYLTVVDVLPDSPARKAGLKSGDKIVSISAINIPKIGQPTNEDVSLITQKSENNVILEIERGDKLLNFEILPQEGIIEGKKAIGINMDMVGILSLPPHRAIYEGAKVTWHITKLTVEGLVKLIGRAFVGRADLSQVSGPVGIIGLVGDASQLGFAYLLTFAALISINLAIINLVPFPALDGGRILFVFIEAVTGRRINARIANSTNTIGFALLIILMLIITYRDIVKLF